jgi:hypothetical protein
MLKPFPHGKEKAQLWLRIKAEAPDLAATINTFTEQFPGSKLKSFDFAGDTYYDPHDPPPPPEKVFVVDDSFLMRFPAAERQKYMAQPGSAYDRAVAAKKLNKKGKR